MHGPNGFASGSQGVHGCVTETVHPAQRPRGEKIPQANPAGDIHRDKNDTRRPFRKRHS